MDAQCCSDIPSLRQRVINVTLGVLLVTYAAFFFVSYAIVGMMHIAVRRLRMRLPPQRPSALS